MISPDWKWIPYYEGVYQVSRFGDILRVETGRILKPFPDTKYYQCVKLSKLGKQENVKIHKLVALLFVPNPYHLPTVNHKDLSRLNNRWDNLEWMTFFNNTRHAVNLKRAANSRRWPIKWIQI